MTDKCKICGKPLDWRKDESEAGVCAICSEDIAAKTRTELLEGIKLMSMEDRLARLEALLYDHECRHPGKVLWQ